MRNGKRVTAALALIALTLTGIGTQGSAGVVERRIYPAPTLPLTADGTAAELVEAVTADGLRLRGLWVAPGSGQPVVLLFHGNGSSARDALAWLKPALPTGFGVMAAEYRGYSGNPGQPSEAGLVRDAVAFRELVATRAPGAPVWLVGHSLGGGVAFAAARQVPSAVLVTIGTFTRLRDAAPPMARFLVPDAYRNIDRLAGLARPYYLIHGTADDVVPAAIGERLHRAAVAARASGAAFVIVGAGHAPPATQLAAVFRTVDSRLRTGSFAAALPAEIKLIPFDSTSPQGIDNKSQ